MQILFWAGASKENLMANMLVVDAWPHNQTCQLCLQASNTTVHICKDCTFSIAAWNHIKVWTGENIPEDHTASARWGSLIDGTSCWSRRPKKLSGERVECFCSPSGMFGRSGTAICSEARTWPTLRWPLHSRMPTKGRLLLVRHKTLMVLVNIHLCVLRSRDFEKFPPNTVTSLHKHYFPSYIWKGTAPVSFSKKNTTYKY